MDQSGPLCINLLRICKYRRARRGGRVGLYTVYQPIYNLKAMRIEGYEALLRDRNQTPEAMFTNALKNNEHISLDLHAMKLAIQHFDFCQDLRLYINCRPETFETTEFIEYIHSLQLRCTKSITIEVTEQAVLHPEKAKENAKLLREKGIKIAIDDFGHGQSNLRNIEILDPDVVKLDKSLIKNICNNAKTKYLIIGLHEMAKSIDAQLLAEGVESADMAEVVKHCGVELGQGWHYGRPEQIISKREAIL